MSISNSDIVFPDLDDFSRKRRGYWEKLEKKRKLLYIALSLPDEGELIEKYDQNLAKKIVYRMIDGGETRVIAGMPVFIPLDKLCQAANITLAQEILALQDDYNFGYLKLACGFGGHRDSPHPMISGTMTANMNLNIVLLTVYYYLQHINT